MYAILDCETGGLDPMVHPILTLHVDFTNQNLDTIDELSIEIHSLGRPCVSGAMEHNKIDLVEHDKRALQPREAGLKTHEFFSNIKRLSHGPLILVGQNLDFDLGFIEQIFPGFTKTYKRNVIDTRDLSTLAMTQGLIPTKSASLQEVRKALNLEMPEAVAHTGRGDVAVTKEVLRHYITLMRKGAQHDTGYQRL